MFSLLSSVESQGEQRIVELLDSKPDITCLLFALKPILDLQEILENEELYQALDHTNIDNLENDSLVGFYNQLWELVENDIRKSSGIDSIKIDNTLS